MSQPFRVQKSRKKNFLSKAALVSKNQFLFCFVFLKKDVRICSYIFQVVYVTGTLDMVL